MEGWLEIWSGCSPDSHHSQAESGKSRRIAGRWPLGSVPLAREDEPETCGLARGKDQGHSDAHITISRYEQGLGDVDGGNGEKWGGRGFCTPF